MSGPCPLALAAVLTWFAAAPLAAHATTTVTWVERTTNEHEVDIAPTGDSNGDLIVFANPLYDAADKNPVGESRGFCMRTDPGKSWECQWTMHLAQGSLTVSGTYWDKGDSQFAVLGAGGVYAGARGTLKLHPRDDGHTSYDFVVTLH
jgi:allene oxide cyclase